MADVIVSCPDCGDEVDFFLKEGVDTVYLDDDPEDLPLSSMKDLDGQSKRCPRCSHKVKLTLHARLKVS